MTSTSESGGGSGGFKIGQRVHSVGDTRRIGTVKYVGAVEGTTGTWIGVDWDNDGDGKHDGHHNGVKYFEAKGPKTASFARAHALSPGITLLEALELRYRSTSTKEEEDEMYVLSASNKRVSIQLLGKEKIQDKLSRFEELTNAALSYLGVSSLGASDHISATIPNLKELDLRGNLLFDWKDIGIMCNELPALAALNLSNNLLSHDVTGMPQLNNIRILVLNHTGITWRQVEVLKDSLPHLEELHLMGNKLREITGNGELNLFTQMQKDMPARTCCNGVNPMQLLAKENEILLHEFTWENKLKQLNIFQSEETIWLWLELLDFRIENSYQKMPASSVNVQGFESLRLLNLEDNNLASWDEILMLAQLRCLEQLLVNKNYLNHIWYPDNGGVHQPENGSKSPEKNIKLFENLRRLFLGGNNVEDVASVDALNSFPKLVDIRLSENPVTDPVKGGISRYVLIARLAKVEFLNGSEVSARERKESEIRYVRLVMSKFYDDCEQIKRLHPRFEELKAYHGIEDARPSTGPAGPQKMASGLISINLKCVGASMGEKPPLTKKLPASTTVGKLKNLCGSFFKLKSIKPKLFLQEEGSPLPTLLDDEMASLIDIGVGNESTILVDEEC